MKLPNLLKWYVAKYMYLYLKLHGQFFNRAHLEALVTIKTIYSSVYGGTYIKIAFHAWH